MGIPVYEGYGLSECASVVSLNTPTASKPGTAGKVLPHASIRIADDGELEVSGSILTRYLHAPDNQVCEYFPTGDLGFIDSHGNGAF